MTEGTVSLTYATLRDQIGALQAKRISAAELLEEAIARIAEHDGKINAVIARDFEGARIAARKADHALARGERKPLLGAPVTVKEVLQRRGIADHLGIPGGARLAPHRRRGTGEPAQGRRRGRGRQDQRAAVSQRLAGVQRSLRHDQQSLGSRPDLRRIVGRLGGVARGRICRPRARSDIGGSLRVPAHFCGVFAHKPTYALLPMRGQTPPGLPPVPLQPDLAVVGPLARSAADLSLALDLLAGPDEAEAIAYSLALPPPRADRLDGFRVLVLDTPRSSPLRRRCAQPSTASLRAWSGPERRWPGRAPSYQISRW